MERSEQEILKNLGNVDEAAEGTSTAHKEPISLDLVKKVNFISQNKRPYCNFCGSLCGMFWFKKISDDTGNPELVDKSLESAVKSANDNVKQDIVKEEAKTKENEAQQSNQPAATELAPVDPNSNGVQPEKQDNHFVKKSKIVEPVEEYKMKKELGDLSYTYNLCVT